MELGRFRELVESALAAKSCIAAFISCEVVYSGRAETFLPFGDRLIVIKQDASLLIHQPEGTTPINYMKGGSQLSFERDDGALILYVHNLKEKAWLDLNIKEVFSAEQKRLHDGQSIDLAGNEKDMSDWIRDNPACIADDFRPIAREAQTDVGFIDVLGHDGTGKLVVVECKRVTASLSAVDQLRRYVERVAKVRGVDEITGIIAAPAITANAAEMLKSWGYTFCEVVPPKRLERWQKDQKQLGDF